jgi:mRNA interferase MazF
VVARGDVVWADLPPIGRRPVCILTRDAALSMLTAVTCAPITRSVRGIRSEVAVGRKEGLRARSAISCDNLLTIPLHLLDEEPVGQLDRAARARLDAALRYALDIRY